MPGGKPLKAGELLKNPDYAATLRKLVEAEQQAKSGGAIRGHQARRSIASTKATSRRSSSASSRRTAACMRAADLAAYEPKWTEPLHTTYRGYDVYSNPSTSRGGFEVLMQANLVEGFDLKGFRRAVAEDAARRDRSDQDREGRHLPVRRRSEVRRRCRPPGMLSKEYAATRRALIDFAKAGRLPGRRARRQEPRARHSRPQGAKPFDDDYDAEQHTTSFSIVDRFGNAIGVTPTLGGLFGNNVVVGNTGLLLNNGMRLGSTSPYPTDVNYVGAGKIPILNNSPVVVLKDGKLAFVFGTPGGETIGQTEFQVLVNLVDFELPVQQAIEAPRFVLDAEPNFYKPGAEITVNIESRTPADTIAALKAMGHKLRVLPGWGSLGHMQAIRVDPKTGTMMAGADPRRTGYAVGY